MKNGLEPDAFSGAAAGDETGGGDDTRHVENAAHAAENATTPVPVIVAPEDFRPMPPWMRVALREIGQREMRGAEENPRILQYHATTTLGAKSDEVPWCSSFVNWVLAKAHMERTFSAAAKSWLEWGYAIEKPIYGAIVVLSRTGGNHVGFFVDQTPDGKWILLGGNQSDAVNETAYTADRVIGVRWPHGWAESDFRPKK